MNTENLSKSTQHLDYDSAPPKQPTLDLGQVAIAIFFLGMAGVMAWQITDMPTGGGYSGVSPRMVPGFVGCGLLLVGVSLLYQSLTGGFRGATHDGEGTAPKIHAVLWILGGLVCFMLLAKTLGFVLVAMVLFAATARGFGSVRWKNDLLWGAGVGLTAFLFFNRVLSVDLPAGVLQFLVKQV